MYLGQMWWWAARRLVRKERAWYADPCRESLRGCAFETTTWIDERRHVAVEAGHGDDGDELRLGEMAEDKGERRTRGFESLSSAQLMSAAICRRESS